MNRKDLKSDTVDLKSDTVDLSSLLRSRTIKNNTFNSCAPFHHTEKFSEYNKALFTKKQEFVKLALYEFCYHSKLVTFFEEFYNGGDVFLHKRKLKLRLRTSLSYSYPSFYYY